VNCCQSFDSLDNDDHVRLIIKVIVSSLLVNCISHSIPGTLMIILFISFAETARTPMSTEGGLLPRPPPLMHSLNTYPQSQNPSFIPDRTERRYIYIYIYIYYIYIHYSQYSVKRDLIECQKRPNLVAIRVQNHGGLHVRKFHWKFHSRKFH